MFSHTKPPAGTQINPLHPLSEGLVGCWLFNEGAGSLSNDLSGCKNHGRLTNMAPNVQGSGWGSGGLGFDGVDDYVGCGNNKSLTLTDAITIVAGINPNTIAGGDVFSSTNPRYIIFKGAGSDDSNYLFRILGNRLDFVFYADGGWRGIREPVGNGSVVVGVDQYVALTFESNGTARIYYNGAETCSTDLAYGMIASTADFAIGGDPIGSQRWSDGSIRSVNIFNQVKSAEEIAWLYREPYAMFEPSFNPALLYSAAPPVGAIMNQFQKANIGADLYNGVFA